MKVFGIIVIVLVLCGAAAYVDGAHLPYDHSVSVTGTVAAPPDKVFALITNVANGADWRSGIKSVTVLQPVLGRDHWVEHPKYGTYMTFLAVRSDPPAKPTDPNAATQGIVARRDVQLDDPNASYGGTWSYELLPGPDPSTTTLRITETGFIKPPLYRFIVTHIIGPAHNLNQYMTDIQAAARKQ